MSKQTLIRPQRGTADQTSTYRNNSCIPESEIDPSFTNLHGPVEQTKVLTYPTNSSGNIIMKLILRIVLFTLISAIAEQNKQLSAEIHLAGWTRVFISGHMAADKAAAALIIPDARNKEDAPERDRRENWIEPRDRACIAALLTFNLMLTRRLSHAGTGNGCR